MIVPMIVLAIENALLLWKNETKKSTSVVLLNVESKINPKILSSCTPVNITPPPLSRYSWQSTSAP